MPWLHPFVVLPKRLGCRHNNSSTQCQNVKDSLTKIFYIHSLDWLYYVL
jgi:hypothetical protein